MCWAGGSKRTVDWRGDERVLAWSDEMGAGGEAAMQGRMSASDRPESRAKEALVEECGALLIVGRL